MRMLDQTKAFPKAVLIDKYKPLIDAALKASNGDDGLPRVVVEDYDTAQLALKAANAIRNHCHANKLEIRVSCPENSKSVFIWKGKRHPRKKKNAAPAVPAGEAITES